MADIAVMNILMQGLHDLTETADFAFGTTEQMQHESESSAPSYARERGEFVHRLLQCS